MPLTPPPSDHSPDALSHPGADSNAAWLAIQQMNERIIDLPHLTIGLAAPKGTGKDTTARRLRNPYRHPDGVIRAAPWLNAYQAGAYFTDSFAEPLYRMVAILTGLSVEQLQDEHLKDVVWQFSPDEPDIAANLKYAPSNFTSRHTAPTASLVGWGPRRLLEHLGTEFVRDKIAQDHWVQLMKARLARKSRGITVITDVRFPNEAAICDLVVELRREGKEYGDSTSHISKQRLPACFIDLTVTLSDPMNYVLFADTVLSWAILTRATGRSPEIVAERKGH